MLTIHDVCVELQTATRMAEMIKLRDHFKALSIDAIGLDPGDFKPRTKELSFTLYGSLNPYVMKKMILECTEHVFPGSFVDVFARA